MIVERIVLKDNLDVMSIDQLIRELKAFPKTAVTVTLRGYDVNGKDPLRLEELHVGAGDTVMVSCDGVGEAACIKAIAALLT